VYLENFLGGEPVTVERLDLLWRHYVRKEQFVKAARVLAAMAESKYVTLCLFFQTPRLRLIVSNFARLYSFPFAKRLEMLQMAVTNAKSSSLAVIDTDYLRDLEDKKDVSSMVWHKSAFSKSFIKGCFDTNGSHQCSKAK
jgi:hypothetical protein